MEKYDIDHRKKIIEKWNRNYFNIKRIKDKERKQRQAKIDLAILEQKLKDNKNYDEDIKFQDIDKEYYAESDEEKEKRYRDVKNKNIIKRSNERIKNDNDYGESDETISNNEL